MAHRQRESFPSEPAPELEAKRPPPQPKTTAMGGSGGEMIKAASGVDPFGNNNVIHRGGSSLAGGAATTTTTTNDAAAAELLPSDEDAVMPSYSRRWLVDDKHYCRRNHHGSRTTRNCAAPQSEFDDLEVEFETLDDYRQETSNHDGRAPLQTINQQNHHQFGGSVYGATPSDHARIQKFLFVNLQEEAQDDGKHHQGMELQKMHLDAQIPLQRMYDVFESESRCGEFILLPRGNDDDIVHGGRHQGRYEEEPNSTSH